MIRSVDELSEANLLLESVARTLGQHFRDREPKELFSQLLQDLLKLTSSDFGYIAEVLHDDDAAPYLRTWAITDISWNADTRELYRQHAMLGAGLEFRNLDTLFGWGLREGGRVVIANDAATDPRCSGHPHGHPPLASFAAIPVRRGTGLVGQIAVANRPGGYDETLVRRLGPFVSAIGNLIEACRVDTERQTAEAAVADSRQRLAAIVNNLTDIVTILADDGSFLYASPAGERLLGYPAGQLPAGNVFELVHPGDLELAARAFGDVIAGRRGPTEPLEFRIRGADGQYRVLETVGDDQRHDPAIGGIVLTSHDVTERHQVEARLRETTAEMSALVSALHDGVLLVGRDGNVVFVNDLFAEFAGLPGPCQQHVGRPAWTVDEAMRPRVADPAGFEAATAALIEAGRPVTGETVRMADGRVFERDYLPVLLASAPAPGRLWLYRDVTARVAGEEYKLRMLESERRARESIEEQNRSLRELNAMKNDFVATVSHELRTPLTSIVSFASLLAEEQPGLPADRAEYLSIIQRNADRLIGLVGDLLLIAGVEFGTLEIDRHPFRIATLARAAAGSIGPEAAKRSVALELDLDPDPAPVIADEGRIEQVLANLLSNALKFTPSGGTVTVRTRRMPGAWSVSVADTGIGIPQAELAQLFERFFRGSNTRPDQHPGSGLGLAICHAIVGLHGGTLDVSSEEGRGTCVTVRLPDHPGPDHPGPGGTGPAGTGQGEAE